MIPKGFKKIAENENINGTATASTYFNLERKLLYISLERNGQIDLGFGPFEPAYLDLIVSNLRDVNEMKDYYPL